MTKTVMRRLLLSGTAAIAGVAGGQAHAQAVPPSAAATTKAGTEIRNVASASYSVNGVTQTTTSLPSILVVDRKVNLVVERAQDADTQVSLGQVGAAVAFRVTNKTNDVQDMLLDPDQNLGTIVYVGTDNFDMNNLKAYIDSNGNGQYDLGVDAEATYLDELKPDESRLVFLAGDVPTAQLSQLAIVDLHVTVAAGGGAGTRGAALVQTTLNVINQDAEVDVVFADNDSDGIGGDGLHDGQARSYLAFNVGVRNVDLVVTKTARVISDPVNVLNPKAIPGAVIEYCIVARNSTLGVAASNVTLTDSLPSTITYVPGSLAVGGVGSTCLLDGVPQDDDTDDGVDPATYKGSYDTANRRVTAIIPSVPGSTTLNASFRATIN